MTKITPEQAGGKAICAFLDTIAWSEIGEALLAVSDNGYNVVVGSTPTHPILFHDYSKHPQLYQQAQNSDAAGRYQFMGRYYAPYKAQLHLPDFSPLSQDLWAIQLMRECKAIELIQSFNIQDAIVACHSRWASFPGAGYGQHENNMLDLGRAFGVALARY